jgi:hypothetical protein
MLVKHDFKAPPPQSFAGMTAYDSFWNNKETVRMSSAT